MACKAAHVLVLPLSSGPLPMSKSLLVKDKEGRSLCFCNATEFAACAEERCEMARDQMAEAHQYHRTLQRYAAGDLHSSCESTNTNVTYQASRPRQCLL